MTFFAAGTQSYYNPLLDVPYYLLAVKWLPGHPRLVAFLAGFPYGGLVFFTWLIARKVAAKAGFNASLGTGSVALLTTILGVTGSATIAQLGTTFNEVPQAVITLAGLYVLMLSFDNLSEKDRRKRYLIAGALFGSAAGLKLTSLPFTVGAALALFFMVRGWKARFLAVSLFSLAWLALFGSLCGWWLYQIWQLTGNPLFPYFNNLFASAWLPPFRYVDVRFLPKSILQAIFYPFFWIFQKGTTVAEIPFSDFRFALDYLAVLLLAGTFLFRKLTKRGGGAPAGPSTNPEDDRISGLLLIFVISSYVLWEYTSSIFRYAVSIEVLSGVLLMLGIQKSGLLKRSQIPALLILALGLLMVTTRYLDYGRTGYASRTFEIAAPVLPDHSMVLLVSAPIGYVAPFLRTASGEPPIFVGTYEGTYTSAKDYKLVKLIQKKIDKHTGPLYVLSRPEVWKGDFLLSAYGLSLDTTSVQKISSNIDEPLNLFRVEEK